jgi:hypothetical protein
VVQDSLDQWCCDESDGHFYTAPYKVHDDGSVTVQDEKGKMIHIPTAKVLDATAPNGQAVWWYLDYPGGRTTFCFAHGSGT